MDIRCKMNIVMWVLIQKYISSHDKVEKLLNVLYAYENILQASRLRSVKQYRNSTQAHFSLFDIALTGGKKARPKQEACGIGSKTQGRRSSFSDLNVSQILKTAWRYLRCVGQLIHNVMRKHIYALLLTCCLCMGTPWADQQGTVLLMRVMSSASQWEQHL